ncbi:hypothetical protein OAT16_11505 [Prolixibacteraceae bacterium]|nr:hypothetical protein [Prolixibacteraceae bacterium]
MKTYRYITLFAFAFLALLLSSCESQYFHYYNVKNDTALGIKLRMFIGTDSTDVDIAANQEIKIQEYTDQTNDIDSERIVTLYDSILVYNSSASVLFMRWDKVTDIYKDLNYANFYYQGDWQYQLNNTSTSFTLGLDDIKIYRNENGLPNIPEVP